MSTTHDTDELTAGIETALRTPTASTVKRLHVGDGDGGTLCGCVSPTGGWAEVDLDAYPPAWRRWCKDCLDYLRGEVRHEGTSDRECPLCGATVSAVSLPDHIAACGGGEK